MTVDPGGPMREARIDLIALGRNVASLIATGGDLVVDVAGDAYGHGAAPIASAALASGARGVRVRDDLERAELVDAGIDARVIRIDADGAEVTDAVYGVAQTVDTAPIMRVSARVISVKTVDAGEPVSYGYTWRAPTRSTLALVPLGYADGVTRSASNRARAWLAGAMRPVVGRVAMNVMVLDLGSDEVELDDEVVLFGDPTVGEGAEEWARVLSAGEPAPLSALEVTAGIGVTVGRRYRG